MSDIQQDPRFRQLVRARLSRRNVLQGADFPSGLVGVMEGLILFSALGCELLRRYRVRVVRRTGHEPTVPATEPAS